MIELTFNGLNIATFSDAYQTGNASQNDLELTLNNVQAIGTATEEFTLRQTQASSNSEEFDNGQFWELVASDGTVIATSLNPGDDLYDRLGATDEYIIFQSGSFGNLIIGVQDFPTSPQSITYTQDDENGAADKGDNDGNFDFAEAICFARGAEIETPDGRRCVETLGVGDMVCTLDHGPQRILWCAQSEISLVPQAKRDDVPVRLRSGCLGDGIPHRDLTVSPQHLILLGGWPIELNFGCEEVFAPAKALVDDAAIFRLNGLTKITYHHIMCANHEIIFANSVPCETFRAGAQAISTLSASARMSLMRAALRTENDEVARPVVKSGLVAAIRSAVIRNSDVPQSRLAKAA